MTVRKRQIIFIAAITAIAVGVVVKIFTGETDIQKAGRLSAEALSLNDCAVEFEASIHSEDGEALYLNADGVLSAEKGQAQLLLSGMQGEKELFPDGGTPVVLDGDTLHIKTASLVELFGNSERLENADELLKTYVSFYLPSYQIPTLTSKPEWFDNIAACIGTYQRDLKNTVKGIKAVKEKDAYTITLDTKQLCVLVDQMAEAGTFNAAQYYINLQGAQLNYITAMQTSSLYFGDALAEYVNGQRKALPEQVLEGGAEIARLIREYGDTLKEMISQNNLSVIYKIRMYKGTYTQSLSIRYDSGNADFSIVKRPADTAIEVPEDSMDFEAYIAAFADQSTQESWEPVPVS